MTHMKKPDAARTLKHLKDAYARAAQAFMRLHFSARLAETAAQGDRAQLLRTIAEEERHRALSCLEMMVAHGAEDPQIVSGRLERNVEAMIKARQKESTRIYRRYSEVAAEEGYLEIARRFHELARIGLAHAELMQQWLRPGIPQSC